MTGLEAKASPRNCWFLPMHWPHCCDLAGGVEDAIAIGVVLVTASEPPSRKRADG